jgi:hypothetical protein
MNIILDLFKEEIKDIVERFYFPIGYAIESGRNSSIIVFVRN